MNKHVLVGKIVDLLNKSDKGLMTRCELVEKLIDDNGFDIVPKDSEKSSDISAIIGRLPVGTKVKYEGMTLTVKTNHEDFNQEPAYRMEGKPDEMFINSDFEALITDDL